MILFGVKFHGGQHSHNTRGLWQSKSQVWPHIFGKYFLIPFMCIIITGTKTVLIIFLEPELGFLILGYEKFAQVVVFFITYPEMMGFTEVWCLSPGYSNFWVCYIRVIRKVLQLGSEYSQFWHNRPLNT